MVSAFLFIWTDGYSHRNIKEKKRSYNARLVRQVESLILRDLHYILAVKIAKIEAKMFPYPATARFLVTMDSQAAL